MSFGLLADILQRAATFYSLNQCLNYEKLFLAMRGLDFIQPSEVGRGSFTRKASVFLQD